jgi:hypothetical protein
MPQIGTYGDIVFTTSPTKINTIDDIEWDSSAKFSEHDRHLEDPLPEFTGNDNDEFSFKMYFSTSLGVDPMAEITKLLKAKRAGKAEFLILGTKAYGKNKWVITKLKQKLKRYDPKGNLLERKPPCRCWRTGGIGGSL